MRKVFIKREGAVAADCGQGCAEAQIRFRLDYQIICENFDREEEEEEVIAHLLGYVNWHKTGENNYTFNSSTH